MCLANEQWVRCKGTERQHPWYDTSACNLLILANLLIHNALFSWRSSTCSSGNCKTLLLSLKDEAAHLYDPPRAYGHPKNLQHLYGSAQVQVHLTKANKKTKHVISGLSEFPCFSVGWWRHLWWTGASIISWLCIQKVHFGYLDRSSEIPHVNACFQIDQICCLCQSSDGLTHPLKRGERSE